MNSRRTRFHSVLAVLLAIFAVLPTAVLFTRIWQDNSHDRSHVRVERKGVEYLNRLTALIGGLIEAQSSALQDVTQPPASLTTAVAEMSAVDGRLGDELGASPRWSGLRAEIGKLPQVTGGKLVVYQAHVQVADLALALFAEVRRNSRLVRDAAPDISNLQQAVAVDMPTAMVEVSRMGDLASLLPAWTGAARDNIATQLDLAALNSQDAVNTLTDSLQNAVDDTTSATLSGNLVGALDSFRRGVESMTRGANLGGAPSAATISTARTALQTSLTTLAGVGLNEIDGILADRAGELDLRRTEALGAGAAALLLMVMALILPLVGRRRKTGPLTGSVDNGQFAAEQHGYGPHDVPPNVGNLDPRWRERSGALR